MRFPRASGVLLHPTSLPGPHGSGDLGAAAYHFVDWLQRAGQQLWQVLPLGGIGPGNSPYMSPSAFAGNELLIDLEALQREGWLDARDLLPEPGLDDAAVHFAAMAPYRMQRLARAAERFAERGSDAQHTAFAGFCAQHAGWLDDYALFMALADAQGWRDWCDWPAGLARREPAALAAAAAQHVAAMHLRRFCQWCFFSQWAALKRYANQLGVQIIGDAPIFVAHQSADVWSRQSLFLLDEAGRPSVVAGVPPDFFSATGQRWGNPLYRWSEHAADGFAWWVQRIRHLFELADIVRIDHFRGFAACWEIPAAEPTAERGRWVKAPGQALFKAVARELGPMPIIAEDLGLITPDVEALRRKFGFPGMRILQFAFGGGTEARFLPHHHECDSVVYTGTHDNDTAAGWWAKVSAAERRFAGSYLACDGQDMPWTLIRTALASVADTAVLPLQDVLGLGSEGRMNHPGQASGWWRWRFNWQQVLPWHAERLLELTQLYGRAAAAEQR